jgi:hypothetical protein
VVQRDQKEGACARVSLMLPGTAVIQWAGGLTESKRKIRVANQARSGIRIDLELLCEDADVDGRAEKCRVSEERVCGADDKNQILL